MSHRELLIRAMQGEDPERVDKEIKARNYDLEDMLFYEELRND